MAGDGVVAQPHAVRTLRSTVDSPMPCAVSVNIRLRTCSCGGQLVSLAEQGAVHDPDRLRSCSVGVMSKRVTLIVVMSVIACHGEVPSWSSRTPLRSR